MLSFSPGSFKHFQQCCNFSRTKKSHAGSFLRPAFRSGRRLGLELLDQVLHSTLSFGNGSSECQRTTSLVERAAPDCSAPFMPEVDKGLATSPFIVGVAGRLTLALILSTSAMADLVSCSSALG